MEIEVNDSAGDSEDKDKSNKSTNNSSTKNIKSEEDKKTSKNSSTNQDKKDARSNGRSRGHSKGRSRDRSHGRSRDYRKHRDRSRSREKHRGSRPRRSRSKDRKRSRSRGKSSERHAIRQKIIDNDDREIFRPKIDKKDDEESTESTQKKQRKSKFDVKPLGLEESIFTDNYHSPLQPTIINPTKTLHARRVYVSGVGECTEKDVERFFNTMIQKSANIHLPVKPVVSVFLNREKRYAFVEFTSIEITTQVLGMNGIMFQGNPLKIRRHNDFQQSQLPPEDPNAPRLDLRKIGMSNIEEIRQDYHTSKIIFGGITPKYNEKDLFPIFESMGSLLGLQIFRNTLTLESKCYGYCDYEDLVAADFASSELNGMDIGDCKLVVKKATPDSISQLVKSDTPCEINEVEKEIEGRNIIPKQPTRILAIMNVIPGQILGDPSLVEDYRLDFEEECKRHGTVVSMEFPPDVVDNIGFGTIYIEFEFIDECRQAFLQIYGRKYNERLIYCQYFDEIRYLTKQFKLN